MCVLKWLTSSRSPAPTTFLYKKLKRYDSDEEFEHDPYEHLETETVQSRFTEYSMSSAILPRSEVLQTHDARFEKLYVCGIHNASPKRYFIESRGP